MLLGPIRGQRDTFGSVSVRGNLGWAWQKGLDLVALERELAKSAELSRSERARLALRCHIAVGRNAREVRYLGNRFAYDNRFMPILLPAYLGQIRGLRRALGSTEIGTVVDVGANVGQFAATLLWQLPEAHVWSFEPNRGIFSMLDENAARHANWHPVPFGVAARTEDVDFWAVDGKSSQGSVKRDNAIAGIRSSRPSRQQVSMRQLTRAVLESLGIPGTVDLVKVDVEGAEASALAGLADLKWRYLAIETSVHESRGLTLSGAVELIEAVWGARPAVVWKDDATDGAATLDAILALTG